MAIGYYIVYGWYKKPPEGQESVKKMYAPFKEACKKHDLKLVFYGGPFGVPEPAVHVIKGKVSDWEKAISDPDVNGKTPLEKTRTVMVWDYE
ncbi:hypothetical protein JXL21_06660 [Candidatus Bathyarchaeota archaeon]|nr:hypothetical protein [Candidatus Bathyarchaeota archaeon]